MEGCPLGTVSGLLLAEQRAICVHTPNGTCSRFSSDVVPVTSHLDHSWYQSEQETKVGA